MRLAEAQSIVREVDGRSYSWLQNWGLSLIKEAIRTIEDRKAATEADRERAAGIKVKIWREY